MQKPTLRLFDKISKGKIHLITPDIIEWVLGDMILFFDDNNGEQTVRVCWKKRNRELTHLHVDDEHIEEFISEINNEKNVIVVRGCFLWNELKIIDKSEIKKQTFFRHYSI